MNDTYIKQLETQNQALLEVIAKPHTLNANLSIIINDPSGIIANQADQIRRLKDALDGCAWAIEHGDYPKDSIGAIKAENARTLLAELKQ